MKTSNIHPEEGNSIKKEIPAKLLAGKVVKSVLVIFVLSWISMLSSCVVAVPHERYHRHTVVVEQNYQGGHHDNGKHKGWYKEKGEKKNHGHDKH